MKSTIDKIAADELKLYADNDRETYFRLYVPVCENMKRKIKAGKFDKEKAVHAFMYVADFAAKRYYKEFCSNNVNWFDVFNKATRQAAAAAMLEDFLADNE